MTMPKSMVIQGRQLQGSDIEYICRLIREHPSWHRTRLSKELCALWDWRAANGQVKDIACRTLLRKLHQRGLIRLPNSQSHSGSRRKKHLPKVVHSTDPVEGPLEQLLPLRLLDVRHDPWHANLYTSLLKEYHYLGYAGPVGQNMRYLILDVQDRPLACLLFGSAAWKCAARDRYIGWDRTTCQRNVNLLTNNHRFLILPWVKIKCLASLVLAKSLKQLQGDWEAYYQQPVYLVETFVDRTRFRATCYKASNWQYVGSTQGRSRQDRCHCMKVPVKDVYLYPLHRGFREKLTEP
jgi:hypothetical protein